MRKIIGLLQRKLFTQKSEIVKGRWNLDYEPNIQDRKVYLANMDHCGCCENVKKQKKVNIYDNDYLRPYLV
jgi:hypothetical protein